MKALKEFNIPIEGLKDGVHEFDFQIDKDFFSHIESSPIKDGNFDLTLHFDKRPDMMVLTFEFTGAFKTGCDRCLESINLPVSDNQQLVIKYSDDAREEAEIIYIAPDTKLLNVAKWIYESICLAIPISRVCDDIEHPPCNDKVLGYLDPEDEEQDQKGNPIWEALKKFNKDN